MLLYENDAPSSYEEIKTWFQVWYRDIFDMDVLWKIYGGQFDRIKRDVIQSMDNNFVDYADSETITKLEKFLNIVYDRPKTIEERRTTIKSFAFGEGHIGRKEIKDLLAAFTADAMTVSLIGGRIWITAKKETGNNFDFAEAAPFLERKIPAHLGLGYAVDTERPPLNIRTVTSAAVKQTFTQVSEKAEKTAEMRIYTGSAAAVYTITTLSEAVPIPRKMFLRDAAADGVSEAVFEDENGGTEPVYLKRGETD